MVLDTQYQAKIDVFEEEFKKSKISVTPKVHALIHHVPEFIKMKKKPLGIFSEQASESVHYQYNKHAENFKPSKSTTKKNLRAVCTFNCLRQ